MGKFLRGSVVDRARCEAPKVLHLSDAQEAGKTSEIYTNKLAEDVTRDARQSQTRWAKLHILGFPSSIS
jgi:hypothetical protein